MLGAVLAFLKPIFGIIDKAIPDADQAAKLKAEIQRQVLENDAAELQAAMSIIVAEAKGESWLQRNWRPILMLSIVAIVVNNYLIAPYVGAFGGFELYLDLPAELFNLMVIGVGGYVVGRSGEKIMREYKGGR
jgi:hypothetical protein